MPTDPHSMPLSTQISSSLNDPSSETALQSLASDDQAVPSSDQADLQAESVLQAASSTPKQPRIIALINQKGGVGKTTTTANLGAALAQRGCRVLLLDLDPQAHLTLHLGIDPETLDASVYDMLCTDGTTAESVCQNVDEDLDVLPSEVNLAGIEAELAPKMITGVAQRILQHKVLAYLEASDPYDFVLIDCPPSLGLLTISALVLANEIFVPMQAHFLALQGLSKLLETVSIIRQSFNPKLKVTGVILCMHERQTILAGEVVADLEAFLENSRSNQDLPWCQAQVFQPPIRRNIKLAESPSFGQTIFDYEPHCAGARDYGRLADAIMAQKLATD